MPSSNLPNAGAAPSDVGPRPARARRVRVAGAAVAAVVLLGTPVSGAAPRDQLGPSVPGTAATVPKATTAKKTTARQVARTTKKAAAAKKASPPRSSSSASSSSAKGLKQGAKGAAVAELQTRLQALHYDISDTAGSYGPQTYHAVMAFQKVNGLPRDGQAGPKTLAALETATEPTPLMPDGGPTRVEINLQQQYMAIYDNGALSHLLSISSGTGKPYCDIDPDTKKEYCDVANTPAGSFRVQSRLIGWRESKLGLLYNPLYFNGGIAMHGSKSVPAQPASHGCVRVPMVSAEWLPEAILDGTPVYVWDGTTTLKPIKASGAAATIPFTPTTTTTLAGVTTSLAGATTTTRPGATTVPTSATTAPAATIGLSTTPTATSAMPTSTATAVRLLTTSTVAAATPTTAAPTTLPLITTPR